MSNVTFLRVHVIDYEQKKKHVASL